ncbi:MAG: hypothetical protein ABIH04_07425 [Planctomycetota bacterium]
MNKKAFISVAAILLVCCAVASAQQIRVENDVRPGLFEYNTPGWIPMLVNLKNRTSDTLDLVVRLNVYAPDRDGGDPTFISSKDVSLGPGARKKFYMYVYADVSTVKYTISEQNGRPLVLSLMRKGDGSEEKIYEQEAGVLNVTYDWRSEYNVVLVGRNPNALHDFDARGFDFDPHLLSGRAHYSSSAYGRLSVTGRVKHLEEDGLPDLWIAYINTDVIVLNGGDMRALSTEQKQAIVDYVRMGGTLVVSPPSLEWLIDENNLLHDLVGKPYVEETSLDKWSAYETLAGVAASVPLFRINVRDAGEVRSHESSVTPDIARSRDDAFIAHLVEVNNGRVFLLPFDLSNQTFISSELAKFFLQANVFREPEPIGFDYGGTYYSYGYDPDYGPFIKNELAQSLDLSSQKLLPMWLIAFIAIAYVVLVAPVNFLVLRKWGKPLLFAASVPLIVIVYTGMIFLTGYIYKGSSDLYSEIEVIEATSGSGVGASDRFSGIYSAGVSGMEMEYRGSSILLPFYLTRSKRDGAHVSFDFRGDTTVAESSLGLWEMGYVQTREPRSLGNGVSVERTGNIYTVTNDTPYNLGPGLITSGVGTVCYSFPGAGKGETVHVSISGSGESYCSDETGFARALGYPGEYRDFPVTAMRAYVFERFEKARSSSSFVLVTTFQDDSLPFTPDSSVTKEFDAHILIVRSPVR